MSEVFSRMWAIDLSVFGNVSIGTHLYPRGPKTHKQEFPGSILLLGNHPCSHEEGWCPAEISKFKFFSPSGQAQTCLKNPLCFTAGTEGFHLWTLGCFILLHFWLLEPCIKKYFSGLHYKSHSHPKHNKNYCLLKSQVWVVLPSLKTLCLLKL